MGYSLFQFYRKHSCLKTRLEFTEGTSDVRLVSKEFLKFRETDFEKQKYTLEFWADAVSENPDYREHTPSLGGWRMRGPQERAVPQLQPPGTSHEPGNQAGWRTYTRLKWAASIWPQL